MEVLNMKKFLVSTIIFSMILFCLSYISFDANLTNDTKNTMNNIGNAVSNTSNRLLPAAWKAGIILLAEKTICLPSG